MTLNSDKTQSDHRNVEEIWPLILLVGNFDSKLAHISVILKQANYRVVVASTLEAGLESLKQSPDLMLVESSLLDINPVKFFSKIKSDNRISRIPIILISENVVSDDHRFEMIKLGANAYLCLPFNPSVLLGAVFAELRTQQLLKNKGADSAPGSATIKLVDFDLSEIESLKASEHELAELFKLSPVPAVIYRGPEHVYSRVNSAHDQLVGKSVLGMTMREAFPEIESRKIPELLDQVADTGKAYVSKEVPYKITCEDGKARSIYVHEWFYPFLNSQGHVTSILGMAQDVTEQVQARQEVSSALNALKLNQEHLGLALEAGQMGTWEIDLKTQNLSGSPHLLKIHGIKELQKDLAGAISLTIHPDDQVELRETLAASIKNHTSFKSHYRIIRPSDGAVRWLEGRGKAKYNEEGVANCLLGIVSDITEQKILQLEVERARQELHNYFMQAPVPLVILTGPDHLFTLANAPYERLVGRKVVGKTVREAFSDKIAKDFIPLLDQVYRTGVPYVGNELPIQFPDENGKDIDYWINVGYQPARDKQGNIIGLFAIVHDVTEQVLARKNLEKSEARLLQSQSMLKTMKQIAENERAKLASIFAQSPGAIAVFEGPDHVFTMANLAYVTQFFGGRKDLIGQSVRTAVPEAVEQGFGKLLNQVYQTGEPYIGTEMPIDLLQADGKMRKFHLNLVYQPLRDTAGKITGIVAVIADVTEQVAARKKLQASEARLEEAKRDAERANRAKSAFLANMSHEIRTPLGAISGFVNLLNDSNLPRETASEYLSIVARNSHHLMRLVDDVLDLAKVESGKIAIEMAEFSFIEFLTDFSTFMNLKAVENGIRFELQAEGLLPDFIISDSTRIRQILTNVVGNAIKFTQQGTIRLVIAFNEGRLIFRVIDTGKGISESQRKNLFQAFTQADSSTTRKFGGTGLGLFLTKKLSQAMGGDFHLAESELGKGSTFEASILVSLPHTVRFLPISHFVVGLQDRMQNKATKADLKGFEILLVEDSADNRFLIQQLLKSTGANLTICNDGVDGVEAATSQSHDIILMDIQMPRMDGHEAASNLRAKGLTIPIVALTAHAMKEEYERAIESGFSHFLTKPIDRQSLISLLDQLCHVKKPPFAKGLNSDRTTLH